MAKRAVAIVAGCILALAAIVTLAGILHVPEASIPSDLAGRFVTSGGVRLRVVEEGNGPAILFLHGSPGSIEDWEPVWSRLRDRAHLVAFDRPNHALSAETGDYSLAGNAEVALSLIETLGLRDVVVVGHSYGGSTALAMALRSPPAVRAYVIVDSATYVPSRSATPLMRLVALPGFGKGFVRFFGASSLAPRIAEGIAEQFGGRTPPVGFVDLRVRLWANPKVMRSIAEETIGAAAFLAAQSPRYPSIEAPVRIVAQAASDFRRGAAERLHREVPGSSLRLVERTGHYVQIEQPDAVVEEIRAALDH